MRNIHLLVIGLCSVLMHIHPGLYAQEKKKKNYSLDVLLLTGEHRNGIFKTIDGSNLILKEKDSEVAHTLPGRAYIPHPKPVKECAQCSVSGESRQ